MQFLHLSKLRRHCFFAAGPILFFACVSSVALSFAQEVAAPVETAPAEAGAAQAEVAPEVADGPSAQAAPETNPDRVASGEPNPVEQLPEAPPPKSTSQNKAPQNGAPQAAASLKPVPQTAATPQTRAITPAIVPAITPSSTPSRPSVVTPARSTSGISTPGALMPDGGWDLRDEPVRRNTPRTGEAFPNFPSPVGPESLHAIAARMNLSLPLPQGRIVVDKSERRLDIYNGSTLLKSYQVALGNNPAGHKAKQGDGRTPEGDFYICTRNSKTSAFHIFLGLSYPALPDARRAANSKQITWREYQIIHQRLASRGRPLWETNLGGWVGIHGGTDATFAAKKRRERGTPDWTAGCIALTNREIEEIHAATRLGTPVKVQP